MGRDTSYGEALADLEADIGRRVVAGDDEGLSDAMLAKRWDQYRKGKDLAYYPSRTLELLHREERLVRGVMGPVGCLAGDCRIFTEQGLKTIEELYRIGKEFRIWSRWPNESCHFTWATAPFVKGCEPLITVVVGIEGVEKEYGRFRCAGAHVVQLRSGLWYKVSELAIGAKLMAPEGWGDLEIRGLTMGIEPEPYYDLTVEATGNYIGEWGIVHHNSGKTTGIVADMNMRHLRQRKCKDGVVRDRFALVRGTLTLLNATLVDTWIRMFPKTRTFGSKYGVCGDLSSVHAGVPHVLEIRGFGLDRPGALTTLLSNNFSGGIINEAVTISEAAKDGVVGRCGRYPDMNDAPTGFEKMDGAWKDKDGYWRWFRNHGVSMDTNAASEDTWWYAKSRDGKADPLSEVYMDQPPAAFRVWDDEAERWKYELNMGQRPGVPMAENIDHLQEHWDYYRNIIGSSSAAHIMRYVLCEYSKTEVGTPIFGDFSDRWHVAKTGVPWPAPGTRLYGGMDFGQTRRAVLGYMSPEGRLMVFAEAIDQTGSVETFANNVLRPMLTSHGFAVTDLTLYCDPAGLNRSEHSALGGILLMRACGFDAVPPAHLPNNDVDTRLEAVRHFLTRIIGAKGAVQFDPGCVALIRSIGGGYVWARRKVGADYMDTDEPAKNNHSHIADAFEYLCCGIRWGGDTSKIASMRIGNVRLGEAYMPLWLSAGAASEDSLC